MWNAFNNQLESKNNILKQALMIVANWYELYDM